MRDLTFTEAFGKYGATLSNPQWAFSAIAPDGALVIDCWQHKMTIPEKGVLRYSDCLSRWKQVNTPGRNFFIKHLQQTYTEKHGDLIIASAKDTAKVDAGEDASGIEKTFDVREEFVGQVVSFDGDTYVIDFRKTPHLRCCSEVIVEQKPNEALLRHDVADVTAVLQGSCIHSLLFCCSGQIILASPRECLRSASTRSTPDPSALVCGTRRGLGA